MKKVVIGCLFAGPDLGRDEELFIKEGKKNNVEIVLLDIYRDFADNSLIEDIRRCDVIYNNSAEEFAVEFEKTLEELGKRVIESTKSFYYNEDKWIFYVKCVENKIPVPETILLSEKINNARKELKEFGHWPVILKRVQGTVGEYVDKAENLSDVEKIIRKFWKKGSQKIPIIAQEFIHSPSYRVTVIDGEIVQTALKKNNSWKATGVYAKKIYRFEVDKELKSLVNKICKENSIKICGLDFLKKSGKWVALEINSSPAFDFFESEREEIVGKVIRLLKKEARKNQL